MRYGSLALSVVIALLVGLVAGLAAAPQFLASQRPGASTSQEARLARHSRFTESSKNVFRVYGPDVYRTAVAVSHLVYPGPRTDAHPDAQPGVAILVPSGMEVEPFYSEALAAAALIHHPRNGPILFTDPDRLNPAAAAELRRLNPTGGPDWPQVFIIGRISQAIEDEVKRMGFRAERITGADQYETAALIDERLGRPGHVIIIRGDDPSHGLPGVSWMAHMGDSPMLFTELNRLPDATVRALQARQRPFAVYILGPEEYISRQVEQQLQNIAGTQSVTRIAGNNPFATAVAFARFKQDAFGWGIEGPGHGFYFATPARWQDALAGALTSHLGGHGPLLFVSSDGLPQETRRYLEAVRPTFPDNDPTKAPFNRGYLVASPDIVGFDQQAEIDWLLESIPQGGGAMPEMNGGMPSGH
ncbi:MAG: cell wall-binding repeat-containing protein [Dehalococcoidales bacterium]|nr:cell wall-binding repeat-containing protein [Dehalococcoidales bacterium]